MSMFCSVALRGRQFLAANLIRVFSVILAGLFAVAPVHAQQTSAGDESIEDITILGSRAIIQSTINIKRISTTIIDALSAADIGDLPAL